jgi:hypothetical protein
MRLKLRRCCVIGRGSWIRAGGRRERSRGGWERAGRKNSCQTTVEGPAARDTEGQTRDTTDRLARSRERDGSRSKSKQHPRSSPSFLVEPMGRGHSCERRPKLFACTLQRSGWLLCHAVFRSCPPVRSCRAQSRCAPSHFTVFAFYHGVCAARNCVQSKSQAHGTSAESRVRPHDLGTRSQYQLRFIPMTFQGYTHLTTHCVRGIILLHKDQRSPVAAGYI